MVMRSVSLTWRRVFESLLERYIMTYFVEKIGVYGHGVFAITENLDEAKAAAIEYATLDKDDYHTYVVYKFSLQKGSTCDAEHEVMFDVKKGGVNKWLY